MFKQIIHELVFDDDNTTCSKVINNTTCSKVITRNWMPEMPELAVISHALFKEDISISICILAIKNISDKPNAIVWKNFIYMVSNHLMKNMNEYSKWQEQTNKWNLDLDVQCISDKDLCAITAGDIFSSIATFLNKFSESSEYSAMKKLFSIPEQDISCIITFDGIYGYATLSGAVMGISIDIVGVAKKIGNSFKYIGFYLENSSTAQNMNIWSYLLEKYSMLRINKWDLDSKIQYINR